MTQALPLNGLKATYRYYPYEMLPQYWSLPYYRVDELKMNLFWLVEPEADRMWTQAWAEPPHAVDISTYFSTDLRCALHLPPLDFMSWWKGTGSELVSGVSDRFPPYHLEVMDKRAEWAHRRINRVEAQVYHVDFKKKRLLR